jgi:hypothetical protein
LGRNLTRPSYQSSYAGLIVLFKDVGHWIWPPHSP